MNDRGTAAFADTIAEKASTDKVDYDERGIETVGPAIRATERALYDFDHPLEPNSSKSIEVQQGQYHFLIKKEKD